MDHQTIEGIKCLLKVQVKLILCFQEMRLQMILQVHLCPCDLFCDKIKGVLPKEEKG